VQTERQASQTERRLRETFEAFDVTGTGYVNAAHMRNAIKDLDAGFTDRELDEMIEFADSDGTGEIYYEG